MKHGIQITPAAAIHGREVYFVRQLVKTDAHERYVGDGSPQPVPSNDDTRLLELIRNGVWIEPNEQ